MSTQLQTFEFENSSVSTIIDETGQPWWIASEVCKVIGIINAPVAVARLDDDEKNTICLTDGIAGNPNRTIINESGLYNLIVRSDKPEAKRFRKWVTAEVLPAVRKYGHYDATIAKYAPEIVESIETDPSVIQLRKLLEVTQEQVAQRHRLHTLETTQRQMIEDLNVTTKVATTALSSALAVEASYTGRTGFKTVLGYSISKQYKIEKKDLAVIGRKISLYCKKNGIVRQGVNDERYDEVKSYPLGVLEKHDELFRHYAVN